MQFKPSLEKQLSDLQGLTWSGGVAFVNAADNAETVRNIFPRNGALVDYTIVCNAAPTAETAIEIYHGGVLLTTVAITLASTTWTAPANTLVDAGAVYYAKVNGTSGIKTHLISVIPRAVNR